MEGVHIRKFKFSVVVVFSVFALFLSSAGAAYTADDLANSLYSGWSSSGGGTYGSWYNVALYWLRTIGSDVDTIQSDVASVKTNTSNLATMLTRLTSIDTSLDNIESDVDLIRSDVSAVRSNTNNLSTMLSRLTSMDTSLDNIELHSNALETLLSRSGTLGSDVRDIDTGLAQIYLHTDDIEDYLDNIDYNVSALKSFFDNPEHRALENATNSAVSAATDMVTSNPGGTTQAQKNQAISGFSTSAAGALYTGVSSDSAWGFLTTGDAAYQPGLLPSGRSGNIFAFFSTETMYDLDPSLATRAPQPEVVDYLSLNQQTFDVLKAEGSDQR